MTSARPRHHEEPNRAAPAAVALPVMPTTDGNGAVPPAAPSAAHGTTLHDSHGRVIRDLRLSVTDRCNYRCVYCMDPDFRYMPKQSLLQLGEFVTIARSAASLGVRKLRLTGGEPTLYPQLNDLIDAIGALDIDDLAMTTNGSRLHAMPVARWRRAGLRRLTLSLDSLRDDRVRAITRAPTSLATVIRAIDIAHDAGFAPIKINAVIVRGVNDDEVADFADFARDRDVDMRFIEFMPLDSEHAWRNERVVTAREILRTITARHGLIPEDDGDPHSTSVNYRFADGARGRIGIIASVSAPFCGACSRMRITADGRIRPCLFSHDEWDLRALLRDGADDDAVRRFLIDAMWTKQAGHGINTDGFAQPARTMSSIGG